MTHDRCTFSPLRPLLAALVLLAGLNVSVSAAEYGTAFTYQGSLKSNGLFINGTANLEFRIYAQAAAGIPLTGPIVLANTPVNDGVFTVELDFGMIPQSSQEHWLEIVVNSTIMSPRQKFSPAPLAQASMRVPLVFGGQIHESPFWSTAGGGAFAAPSGITDALYSQARTQMIMPTTCTAKNLHVRNQSIADYPNSTVTLRVNGVNTLLSCAQTSGNGPNCSNTVEKIEIQAGDLVNLHFTPNLPARPISNSENDIRAFVSFSWMCE
jgi:hypothetical protein